MPTVTIPESPVAPGRPAEIYYREAGAGSPVVILHGGWGYEAYPFDAAIEALTPAHRVIAPDRVGYGRSGRVPALPVGFHRLMAEETADLVCGKLGRRAACLTASRTLSGEALPPRPVFPQPDLRLKRFLRGHPRLRELHALAHLGWAFAGHAARRYLDINLGPRS